MVDVDHFKRYNDGYGHGARDICLRTIAQTLARAVQGTQTWVARYGGEEFVVLLLGADHMRAEEMALRLRGSIADLGLEHVGGTMASRSSLSPWGLPHA